MLVKFIQNGAERRFLKTLEERCKVGPHLGCVLFCSFSKASFKTTPDQILPLVKDILSDHSGELYFCDDGDLLIYWRGRINEISKYIIKTLRDNFPRELLSSKDENIFKVFELHNGAEDLRLLVRQKVQSLPKVEEKKISSAPPPPPQKQTKLELSPLQRESLPISLMRRQSRETIEIMIVEDQDFSRKLLMGLFNKEYTCLGAKDGREAIHYFALHAPDIIFLDIELPDQDGHGLANFFKSLDPFVHIVMVTGNHYKKDVEKARENKVQGFIAKPYNKQKLLNVIEAHEKYKLKKG
jgi:CheY-like chemotaxis protein